MLACGPWSRDQEREEGPLLIYTPIMEIWKGKIHFSLCRPLLGVGLYSGAPSFGVPALILEPRGSGKDHEGGKKRKEMCGAWVPQP